MKITKRQLKRIIREEKARLKEGMDLDPSFYAAAPNKYEDEEYNRLMAVIEILDQYPAAHSYLDIEEVANDIIANLIEKGFL